MNNQETNQVNDQRNEKKEQYAPHFDQYEKRNKPLSIFFGRSRIEKFVSGVSYSLSH